MYLMVNKYSETITEHNYFEIILKYKMKKAKRL